MGVVALGKLLFKLDKELLDLNAMEMDEGLAHFLQDVKKDSSGRFEMVNDRGISRKFTVDWEGNTLHGRGIKGFFSPYHASYLLIEKTNDGEIMVSSPDDSEHDKSNQDSFAKNERFEVVLSGMKGFKQDDEKWFQLFQISQQFQLNTNDSSLLCIPHIREFEPFEYQMKSVKSIINRFKGRALLSDEVGLGKTVEAGMAMLEYIMRGLVRKVIILTPPSLVQQWENEMKRKFNQDFIKADDPAFKKRGEDAWSHYNKVIASISTAKRKQHREQIFNEHYDLVIVDEAHHLRNRSTQAWKFVNGISKKYIFLLSATPVQNHLEELYNLITLLKPGQLRTYNYFKKNFIDSSDGIEAKNVDKLKALLSEVMIRNKRSNVDVQFTKRKAYTSIVELASEEHDLYDDISTFIRNKYREDNPSISRFQLKTLQERMGSTYTSMLQTLDSLVTNNEKLSAFDRKALTRFSNRARDMIAKEADHNPKVEKLITILRDFNDKMLIFTKYKKSQVFLANVLKEQGFKVAEFHGGLKRQEKEEQITFFKEKADVLVSTEVGGEGRNLQFCNGMINFDLPWNPMAIEQRIGRIHRIGQTRDVFVYNLVAKDTIEHYILDLLDRKINMFELVVGEVDAILGDIEDDSDFSDLVMKAWAESDDKENIQKELEQIGDKLFENKQRLLKQKQLDDRLF